jgi:hypothetical protein
MVKQSPKSADRSRAGLPFPPDPGKTIKDPLLRGIIRDANISVDQFIELL